MPGPYPDEFRQRALRMLSEGRPDEGRQPVSQAAR